MKRILLLFMLSFIFLYPNFASTKTYDLNNKYIALSFDDGPSEITNEIVNFLYVNNCSATFFVVGNKVETYKDTLNNIVKKGSELGNHTYSHPWLTKLSSDKIIKEIDQTQTIIRNITGYEPTVFRPSYGDINKKLKELINLKIIMWTNDSSDWKYRSSKTIASNVIRNIKPYDIVLMHDTHKRTFEALKIIIPKLKEMGYQIVSVSELLEIKEFYELQQY